MGVLDIASLMVSERDRAFRLALGLTGDPETAADAVQDACLSLLSTQPSGPVESPRAWFLRAVACSARNARRATRRRREREADWAGQQGRGSDMSAPPEAASVREVLAKLGGALEKLDARFRLPLELHYREGLSHAEVATVLDAPKGTVDSNVQRGLSRLRELLAAEGVTAAPAALVAGLANLEMPAAPPALAAVIDKLAAGQGTAAAAPSTSSASALKGGLIVKIGLGVAALGLAAGGVLWAAGGSSGEPKAPSAAEGPSKPAANAGAGAGAAAREHAEDQKYTFAPIVAARKPGKNGRYYAIMGRGILNGPGLAADICDCDDMDVDDAGNVYWTESGQYNILRKWDRTTGLVTTMAGSVCGYLDGPAQRARFGGWGGGGYDGSNIQASGDGRHIFIADNRNGGVLRCLDVEKGLVSTIGRFFAAKEKGGDIYVLSHDGSEAPAGEGYKTLKLPKTTHVPGVTGGTGFWAALDLEKGRLYEHGRGSIYYYDLKTGEPHTLTYNGRLGGTAREIDTSGPLETTNFQCPIGICLSPGGRFLYIGGGDSTSFWRLDLEKKYVKIFSRDADGLCSFQDGREQSATTSFSDWPSVARFSPDGSAAWSAPSGIYRLTPVK